jgi:hypothetical protein
MSNSAKLKFFAEFLDLPGTDFKYDLNYFGRTEQYSIRFQQTGGYSHTVSVPTPVYYRRLEGEHFQKISWVELDSLMHNYASSDWTNRCHTAMYEEVKTILDAVFKCKTILIHGVSKVYGLWKEKLEEDDDSPFRYYELLENFLEPMDFDEALAYLVEKHAR